MARRWIPTVVWSLSGIALLLIPAGCGGPSSSDAGAAKGPKLLFITNTTADWWKAVEKGMQDGGRDLGADVQMRFNAGEIQGQINRLKEAATLPGIQAVAVSAIESDAPGVVAAMKALQDRGIIVITIDSDLAPEHAEARRAYIGTNNVKAGELLGQAAKLIRPEGGKVAVFVGTAAATNARQRSAGFFQGAGDAFKLDKTWQDVNDTTKARNNVQNAVTADPDLDVLLGLWSYNATAIGRVVQNAPEVREHTTVATFDLDEAAVPLIEEGAIDVTACQNPYEIGYQAVKLLKALVEKDEPTIREVLPDGRTRETGVRLIVPSADSPVKSLDADVLTIDEMKQWLASKGLRSS